jgi:hypothetical protein
MLTGEHTFQLRNRKAILHANDIFSYLLLQFRIFFFNDHFKKLLIFFEIIPFFFPSFDGILKLTMFLLDFLCSFGIIPESWCQSFALKFRQSVFFSG